MEKINSVYIENLISKVLNETLEEKTDSLISRIKGNVGEPDNEEKGLSNNEIDDMMNSYVENEELTEDSEEMCEVCGSKMLEGTCMECKINEMKSGLSNDFDYIEEQVSFEDDDEHIEKKEEGDQPVNKEACKYHLKHFGPDDEITKKICGKYGIKPEHLRFSMNERDEKFIQNAVEKQKKKGTTGKFAEWCKKHKLSTKQGEVTKKCIDKAMKSDSSSVVRMANFAKNIKGYHGSKHVKESITLKESELIELITRVIQEQVDANIKVGTSKGLEKYRRVHDKSGQENIDNISAVNKKMKDYLKTGSKEEYTPEARHFPKGNGELSKMSKKAYIPSSAVEDYTENFTAAGQENLDYDEIKPNDEWVESNIVGSSKTGNNPEWANAVETEVNKKRNKVRKDNLLGKAKRKAYNKAPQPIVQDKTGEDVGDKIMAKLESIDDRNKMKIQEEFDKMFKIISYKEKTQ